MQFSFETLSFILTYWVGVLSFPLLCNTVCPGQRKPLLGIEVQELETRLDSPVKAFYLIIFPPLIIVRLKLTTTFPFNAAMRNAQQDNVVQPNSESWTLQLLIIISLSGLILHFH